MYSFPGHYLFRVKNDIARYKQSCYMGLCLAWTRIHAWTRDGCSLIIYMLTDSYTGQDKSWLGMPRNSGEVHAMEIRGKINGEALSAGGEGRVSKSIYPA